MAIEKRISDVDLNGENVNTTYRAALHQKLSSAPTDLGLVKQLLNQDFTQPLSPELTDTIRTLENILIDIERDSRQIIYLSPLGAFGLNAALTKTSPLKIAHITGRPGDVVADPTVELSAEVFRQRMKGSHEPCALGTIHRAVRLQRYKDPKFTTSFEMFSTIDSALSSPRFFEEETIAEHLGKYYGFFRGVFPNAIITVTLGNIRVSERVIPQEARSGGHSYEELSQMFPEQLRRPLTVNELVNEQSAGLFSSLDIQKEIQSLSHLYQRLPQTIQAVTEFDLGRVLGLGHYNGPVFMMHVDGVTIVDGGSVDWVSQLTSNTKERSVVSGLGLEICARLLTQAS